MFLKAFNATMEHEGQYSNHPDDRGGETYMGVARNFYPSWAGWKIVDSLKTDKSFPELLRHNAPLQALVESFYKEKYWDAIYLDLIEEQVALELFDTAVNMGVGKASEFLQRSINILNRNQRNYPNIKVDGAVGPKTIEAYTKVPDGDKYLRKLIVCMKAAWYIEIAERRETQEVFIRGWLNRVNL